MKKDTIYRKDAIKAVTRLCTDGQTANVDGYFIPIRTALFNVLSAMPSADNDKIVSYEELEELLYKNQKWCSEAEIKAHKLEKECDRLKEQLGENWRLCKEELPYEQEEVIVSVCDDSADHVYYYTAVAWMFDNGRWICDNEFLQGKVVAWQPLPKPYKGGDTE